MNFHHCPTPREVLTPVLVYQTTHGHRSKGLFFTKSQRRTEPLSTTKPEYSMKLGPTYPECISRGTLGHNLPQPLCSVKTSNAEKLHHFLSRRRFITKRIFSRAFSAHCTATISEKRLPMSQNSAASAAKSPHKQTNFRCTPERAPRCVTPNLGYTFFDRCLTRPVVNTIPGIMHRLTFSLLHRRSETTGAARSCCNCFLE